MNSKIKLIGATLILAFSALIPAVSAAQSRRDAGFYVGAGFYSNTADLDDVVGGALTVTVSAGKNNISLTVIGRVVGAATASVNTTLSVLITLATNDVYAVSVSKSDDSDTGYGVHAGFRLNQYFAFELGYANLGSYTLTREWAGSNVAFGGADNSTLSVTYEFDTKAFVGSLLGSYPIADNFKIFGRIGYNKSSTDSATNLSNNTLLTASSSTATYAQGSSVSGGVVSPGADLDGGGLVFGAGVEFGLGRNNNILIRGEYNNLKKAFADRADVSQFGASVSYKF